jgi:hypothetical protein
MLETELRELSAEWPPTPDVAAAVAERLASAPAPRRRARLLPAWPAWQLGAAAVAVAIALVLAVPPARSAVLDWLGFGSVRIERAEPAPAPPGAELALGRPVGLERARALAEFPLTVPPALGAPDAVYVADAPGAGTRVDFIYDRRPSRVLVTQFRAVTTPLIEKTVGAATRVERLRVGGDPAYFLSGAEHGFAYLGTDAAFEPQRLAGNTLLVDRSDGVLLRIEGDLTRAEAVRIAASAG